MVFSESVNPYVTRMLDHPARLLPNPSASQVQSLFSAASPSQGVVLDLGCGSGNFLLQLAAREPAFHFLGFELRYKRLVKAAGKMEREGLKNVWLLREQAHRFSEYLLPETLQRVHINFPDPWPKYRQWKHRLISSGFLNTLENCLRPGGTFLLKTDHSGYFLHVLATVSIRPGWSIIGFSNNCARHPGPLPGWPGDITSEFEQLFTLQKKPIFYLALQWRKLEFAG